MSRGRPRDAAEGTLSATGRVPRGHSPTRAPRDVAAELEVRLRALCARVAQERHIPIDEVEDAAQEIVLRFLEDTEGARPPASDADLLTCLWCACEARRQRERRLDGRHARRASGARRTGRTAPTLCPLLAGLVQASRDADGRLAALRTAAARCAHARSVLRDGRPLRAFLLAYEDGRDVREIRRELRLGSERAVVELLRRVSRRVEARLLDRLAECLGAEHGRNGWLEANRERVLELLEEFACAASHERPIRARSRTRRNSPKR